MSGGRFRNCTYEPCRAARYSRHLEPSQIPAKTGIHAATMALLLCTSPSGVELLGSNESNLPPWIPAFAGMTAFTGPHEKSTFPK